MAIRRTVDGRPRSVAWVYYTIITILLLIATVTTTVGAIVFALLTGLYGMYLFRGGRFVLWLW